MRVPAIVVALTVVVGTAAADKNDLLNQLVSHRWMGLSEQPSQGLTTSGKFQLRQQLEMVRETDDTIKGRNYTTLTLDGKRYVWITDVKGKLLRSEDSVELSFTNPRGDPLPSPLGWCTSSGKLKFYEDTGSKHLLKGTLVVGLSASCSGSIVVELQD